MTSDTLEQVAQALDAAPLDAALHARMLAVMRAANDEAGSVAHQLALAALAALGTAPGGQSTLVLYNIATVYAMKGRRKEAIHWYRHTLKVEPGLAIAHQNLAVALEREELREEAAFHRERAYQLQRVFTEAALGDEQHRILILGAGKGTGNVPLETLLSPQKYTRVRYAIDYASEAEDAQLPPYDLVFNGIGDADIATPLATRLAQFVDRCDRPILNPPHAITNTHRHSTAALLESVQDVIVPCCVRIDSCPANIDELASQIDLSGLSFPLLMRPLAMHGGERLEKHTSFATLFPALAELGAPCYLTAWQDFRSEDGYYRKYRVIYVEGKPFPYHLAISSHWLVHYFSANMADESWKLHEELGFLADPVAALGERAFNAIAEIGRRLSLDYGGIDFTLTADGQVLVFETNATMLTHRESQVGPLAHKNPYIDRIIEAFERMLDARAMTPADNCGEHD